MKKAKNATFLFHRDFIEYHSDRFEDHSLMLYKEAKLIAVLPANIKSGILYSHLGLSYGGFVLHETVSFFDVFNVFETTLKYLHTNSIEEFHVKLLPIIYANLPSDEMDYLLFKTQGVLNRTDVTSVIQLDNKLEIKSSNRIRGLKKAIKHQLEIKETDDFEAYWNNILIPNLKQRHNAKPVHSLKEITYLKKKFPNNIRQFNVCQNGEVVAGATIFETKQVARVQYISANENRQKLGGLDMLFHTLINEVYKDKKYFDFGISNENQGENINEGLLLWKESFGARTISHKFYTLQTKSYKELNRVML
ncbi:GNAT family N-acetyltransferase [Marixanthotalea marina]|uniref:GNAT family N-acetyltransferase n=1 Tax=Marixanthotalea marina TaxID=2844359 RepID=UPI002989FB80|nr:GNAT family N-acetyltransferase [Marixanthotalea marina]